MQEGDELPRDFTTMFEINLFKYDFDLVPETIALYKSMSVKHEQLTLIIPQF
jgi:intraflagellar transport protein 52